MVNNLSDAASFLSCDHVQRYGKASSAPIESFFRIAILVIIITLSAFGNGTLILSVIKQEKLRTVTNIFVISQCASDLAFTAFCIIPRMATTISNTWCLGCRYCILYHTITSCFITVSMVHLTLLALDRYILIVRRMTIGWVTKRTVFLVIPSIWIGPFLMYQPWRVLTKADSTHFFIQEDMCFIAHVLDSKWLSGSLSSVFFVSGCFLPLITQLVCFYRIIHALRTCKRQVRPRFSSTWYQIAAKVYAKSAYTILFVAFSFLVSATPFVIVLLRHYLGLSMAYLAYSYTELLMFSNVATKPYLYINRSKHCSSPISAKWCRGNSGHAIHVALQELSQSRAKQMSQLRKTVPYVIGRSCSDEKEATCACDSSTRTTEFYSIFTVKGTTK